MRVLPSDAMPTMEATETQLPNGFHDARLHDLHLDQVHGRLTMLLDVCVEEDGSEDRERRGTLTLDGLLFCVIDPPGPNAQLPCRTPLWIDAGPDQPAGSPVDLPAVDRAVVNIPGPETEQCPRWQLYGPRHRLLHRFESAA